MRIRGANPASSAWAALLALFLFQPAHATLYSVAYDRTEASEKLVRVSTADATITDNAQTALVNCCAFNGSLVAADDSNQTVYVVAPSPVATQAWRLHRISLVSGAAVTVDLPQAERVAALLRSPATATLFALSDAGSGLRLVTISDVGAVTPRGTTLATDCCGVRVGVAALSADATRIAFVARLKTADPSLPLRLWVLDAGSGALVSSADLSNAPDVLFSNSGSTFSAIYHVAGVEYVGSIGAGGVITPIGAGANTCCVMLSGVVARSGNLLRVVGKAMGEANLSLLEVNAATGSFTFVGSLPSRYVINGLVESSVSLASDLIFRDGFDLATGAVADKHAAGVDGGQAIVAASMTGVAAMSELLDAPDTAGLASTPKQLFNDAPGGPSGSSSTIALPLGGPVTWSVLIGLILLVSIRQRRRMH